jgi:signal transduction histidine kinase
MRSIRWKLILAASLVVSVPVLILNRYAVQSFDRFTRKALEEEMIGHARLIGSQYLGLPRESPDRPGRIPDARFIEMVRTCAPRIQSRVQILAPDGTVLVDSDPNAPSGASLADLPHIARAIGGRYGPDWRLTPDRKFVFYFAALPIPDGDRVAGIVHVTRHTGPITTAIRKMILDLRLTLAASVGAAVLLSTLLAHTLTGRLRRLTRAAQDYAKGESILDVPVRGRDEIAQLGAALARMSRDIEQRYRYNQDFVSTVIHELRSPITAIRGAAEILAQGAADNAPARDKFLNNILFEVQRTERMVGALNALTKLDTDIAHEPREDVDYGACVRAILDRLGPTFDPGHAPISLKLPDFPIRARVVSGRIEQVLANLLENAVRYTPPTGRIDVTVEEGPGRTVVTRVADTGCGIAPSNLGRVFDRFFTTEPKGQPREYGSGLGLAVAKTIVESHRGTIAAESAPGQGATFTFVLPAAG